MQTKPPIRILVDADACPVKSEIYRVAERHDLPVIVVANSFIAIPRDAEKVERVIVSDGLDAADDWITENCDLGTVMITSDLPLASLAIEKGVEEIAPTGRLHTDASSGNRLRT